MECPWWRENLYWPLCSPSPCWVATPGPQVITPYAGFDCSPSDPSLSLHSSALDCRGTHLQAALPRLFVSCLLAGSANRSPLGCGAGRDQGISPRHALCLGKPLAASAPARSGWSLPPRATISLNCPCSPRGGNGQR